MTPNISAMKVKPKDMPAVLKSMRKAAGLSQRALGEMLGCQSSSVSNYENGQRKIPIKVLEAVAALHSFEVRFYFQAIKLDDQRRQV